MAGSVGGDERLRLFLGIRLPAGAVEALADWQARELRGAGENVRIVPRENLHITLAFLGSRPTRELPAILDVLRRASADAEPLRFDVTGYRETRSVGMLTLGDEAGAATGLARRLHDDLDELGVYRRESRPWLPHVTVLRFRERPRLRPEPPSLGWVSSDAAAFLSRLHPSGARYEVHDSFRLGG
jgi:RNA 2',3'-cyclic 3'-phosphodiesterase